MTTTTILRRRFSVIVGITALSIAAAAATITPAQAQTTTTKAGAGGTAANAGAAGNARLGQARGGPNRAFCRQLTDSQAVIAAAKGDAIAKLSLTAAEWVKIESQSPTEIKPKVLIVRKAFQDAATAKSATAVKAQTVVDAGKAITTFVTTNCSRGGFGGGGTDSAAFTAYRECLTKQGITLPTPGSGRPLDRNDAKVAAALKAGVNGGGGFGGGGRGFGAIRDCLAKKNITFPPGQGGANGQLDAKTQKAIQECRDQALAVAGSTTTTKKK
jgi:hypothetical protein